MSTRSKDKELSPKPMTISSSNPDKPPARPAESWTKSDDHPKQPLLPQYRESDLLKGLATKPTQR
jgi:hypothetical protein